MRRKEEKKRVRSQTSVNMIVVGLGDAPAQNAEWRQLDRAAVRKWGEGGKLERLNLRAFIRYLHCDDTLRRVFFCRCIFQICARYSGL
jgi:hypothetical protein